jgi:hypothetical protein
MRQEARLLNKRLIIATTLTRFIFYFLLLFFLRQDKLYTYAKEFTQHVNQLKSKTSNTSIFGFTFHASQLYASVLCAQCKVKHVISSLFKNK